MIKDRREWAQVYSPNLGTKIDVQVRLCQFLQEFIDYLYVKTSNK